MPLSPGDKLGPYEILAPIGAGGMGDVYKAHDTRLGRDVAIKVSQERFSDRFEREARAVAALNHPNICTLHDVGPNYLVMEFVEGESPKGPLPLETALGYARQISDALEAAHEKGIVHRDLKPANIKIRPDGTVKVLDFGLAKTIEMASGDTQSSPTLTLSATRAGMIMGTAAYMSPEQARGKSVDKRADIWAFGAVLYEMLTGKMLFHGEDLAETLASVVKDTPDLSGAPAQVRRLLASCLEKDPRKRLRDIGDAWGFLDQAPAAFTATRQRRSWPWAAAAALAAVAAVVGWLRPGPISAALPQITLSIVPPSGIKLKEAGSLGSTPEISPDGSTVVYRTKDQRLYVTRLDSLEPRLVAGLTNSTSFWSANSSTVAYELQRQLTKVRMPDGAPEIVGQLPKVSRGGGWSDDGTILVSAMTELGVFPVSGGQWRAVEMPEPLKKGGYYYPELLPGGQDFLFLFVPTRDAGEPAVYMATLRDGKAVDPVLLLKNQTAPCYTPAGGGRILFVRNDNLYSQKWNRRTRKLEGEAELAVQGVASQPSLTVHRADFSVARNGTIAWRQGKAAVSQVTEFDRGGNRIGTSGPPGSYDFLTLSPDERQLMVSSNETGWLTEVGQSGRSELPKAVRWSGWSAGGMKLMGTRDGALFEMSSNGASEVHELRGPGLTILGALSFSPDGKWAVAQSLRGIVAIALDGTGEITPRIVVDNGTQLTDPVLSPDGRWLLYSTSDAGGGLYVQPFPDPGPRRQIASPVADGGPTSPFWRRDGKEILYRDGDALMSVVVEWGGKLAFGAPRKLFSGLRSPSGGTTSSLPLTVSHDGSHIFWAQGVEQPDSNVIHVKIGAVK